MMLNLSPHSKAVAQGLWRVDMIHRIELGIDNRRCNFDGRHDDSDRRGRIRSCSHRQEFQC